MDLLANDLSVHGQFHDLAAFQEALGRLMATRETARRFGRDIRCGRTFLDATPIPGFPMRKAIGNIGSKERRSSVMSWLDRKGPFWDNCRLHGKDDWLECCEEVVTDSAVGEAGFRSLHNLECGLVSLAPSKWCRSPIEVTWVRSAEGLADRRADLQNWWCEKTLSHALEKHAAPLRSWEGLREASEHRFQRLTFAKNCFKPLSRLPFSKSSANRFLELLHILDRYANAFDDEGRLSPEGNELYKNHFTGDNARFSDSSDGEKRDFENQLTFTHPEDPARSLFCTWHGKIPHLTLRLHFSWPVQSGKPVYVVYAGPKITKR